MYLMGRSRRRRRRDNYSLKFELNPNYCDGRIVTEAEVYYKLYLRERAKRMRYERKAKAALAYVVKATHMPSPFRKALIKHLK